MISDHFHPPQRVESKTIWYLGVIYYLGPTEKIMQPHHSDIQKSASHLNVGAHYCWQWHLHPTSGFTGVHHKRSCLVCDSIYICILFVSRNRAKERKKNVGRIGKLAQENYFTSAVRVSQLCQREYLWGQRGLYAANHSESGCVSKRNWT